MQKKVFPAEWTLIPVAGKATYVREWGEHKRKHIDSEGLFWEDSRYQGFGVVTGELSGGLIALDIDGHDADGRFKAEVGEAYEAHGAETTMSWTSGKPGRRQLLYRVPEHMLISMRHINTIILRLDQTWALGQGDSNRTAKEASEPEYEEVVLRFNRCQSVLPRSPHPEKGRKYTFLNYNGGQPAEAPEWVLDVIRQHLKPQGWLTDAEMTELESEAGQTLIPSKQIRGWFFSEEVQAQLMPRLEDLIFKHPTFYDYGWQTRPSKNPHRVSGCPWHGGKSGTSFQYSELTGCWDCKACGVGGDVLDFVHKIETGDKFAGRPKGPALETYVARLAPELGYKYPDDAQMVQRSEVSFKPQVKMGPESFFDSLSNLLKRNPNPATAKDLMQDLAQTTGRRMTGIDCIKAEQEYRAYKQAQMTNAKPWWEVEKMTFTIPNLMMKPSQIILHAAPGKGKTSAAMGFARMVGQGEPMTIRGIKVPVPAGKVLWIQNDQNPAKLYRDCEDNGIDAEKDSGWFIVRKGFQMNYLADLTTWINEIKPALVVIDSIGSCSTDMQEQEKDKAFASPLYYYARMNGEDPELGGFHPCTILWIHHDNAQGEVRGTRYLTAAVDEQWHLRELSGEERERIRAEGRTASNCRYIQVKKSRLGREGDCLVVERDVNGVYSVWDHTPTERRMDEGQGDPEPSTIALRIVRDRARGTTTLEERRMTAAEVWEPLVEEVTGQGREAPSKKSVHRWLTRWVEDGVLVLGGNVPAGPKQKPAKSYAIPLEPPRAGGEKRCPLSLYGAEPLRQHDLYKDTPEGDLTGVPISDASPYKDTSPEAENGVPIRNRCDGGDLPHIGTTDTFSNGTEAPNQLNTPETHDKTSEALQPAEECLEGLPGPEGDAPVHLPRDRQESPDRHRGGAEGEAQCGGALAEGASDLAANSRVKVWMNPSVDELTPPEQDSEDWSKYDEYFF
uniref:bifunctional DNA primase/polymerase n=1 Tax=Synechococcus sp. CS-1329 TaxID=2847975 RepID=UPI00223C4FD2|nr:bifunctional DNA primase/polymerase [Synechococcus sp. CS-1329]